MTDGEWQKVAMRAYRDTYLLWVGLGILAAAVSLFASYLVSGGTYTLAAAGVWNLAFPFGCLIVGIAVAAIGLGVAARAYRRVRPPR
jgi:hypothetical protein